MHVALVWTVAVLSALGLVVALRLTKRPAIPAALLVFVALSGALGVFYLTNESVRATVDSWLDPVKEHQVLTEGGHSLPLPPHTALRFRFSASGARYFSRLSSDEVLDFYREVTRLGEMARDGQSIRLPVQYKGSGYLLLISPRESGGVDLQVDAL